MVFVIYWGDSCCFDEDVHPFTSLFIMSTRILLLHLRIPISSSSLLLTFISLFTVSTWLFLLHLISSSSLLLPSLYCGFSTLAFELEVLLVAWLVQDVLFTKQPFLRIIRCTFLFFVSVLFLCSFFQLLLHSASSIDFFKLYLSKDIFIHI